MIVSYIFCLEHLGAPWCLGGAWAPLVIRHCLRAIRFFQHTARQQIQIQDGHDTVGLIFCQFFKGTRCGCLTVHYSIKFNNPENSLHGSTAAEEGSHSYLVFYICAQFIHIDIGHECIVFRTLYC